MGVLGNGALRAILGQIRGNKQRNEENYIMRNLKNWKTQRVLVGKLKEKDQSSDINVDKSIMLSMYSLPVTLRSTTFYIKKFCMLITLRLCVLCGSQNKQ